MSDVLLVDARPEHIPLVASRMRIKDREEVRASGGFDPESALVSALAHSEFARVAYIRGEVAAMFGVARVPTMEAAIPWLLTTDTVDRYPLTFYRASKIVFRELREAYPDLVQYVDARHTSALSWAKRLGFDVAEKPMPFGKKGHPFHRIALRGG